MTEYIEIGNLTTGLIAGVMVTLLILRGDVRQFLEENKGGKLSSTRLAGLLIICGILYIMVKKQLIPDISGWWFALVICLFFLRNLNMDQITKLIETLRGK